MCGSLQEVDAIHLYEVVNKIDKLISIEVCNIDLKIAKKKQQQ